MPGVSGVTVVTTLVCFLFCTQGCGRIARPAFPAPFDFIGQDLQSKTRTHRAAGMRNHIPTSLRGAFATKQSSFLNFRKESWIASLALAMTLIGCLIFESVGWAKAHLRRAHHVNAN
jgi:hypothetical protein